MRERLLSLKEMNQLNTFGQRIMLTLETEIKEGLRAQRQAGVEAAIKESLMFRAAKAVMDDPDLIDAAEKLVGDWQDLSRFPVTHPPSLELWAGNREHPAVWLCGYRVGDTQLFQTHGDCTVAAAVLELPSTVGYLRESHAVSAGTDPATEEQILAPLTSRAIAQGSIVSIPPRTTYCHQAAGRFVCTLELLYPPPIRSDFFEVGQSNLLKFVACYNHLALQTKRRAKQAAVAASLKEETVMPIVPSCRKEMLVVD